MPKSAFEGIQKKSRLLTSYCCCMATLPLCKIWTEPVTRFWQSYSYWRALPFPNTEKWI